MWTVWSIMLMRCVIFLFWGGGGVWLPNLALTLCIQTLYCASQSQSQLRLKPTTSLFVVFVAGNSSTTTTTTEHPTSATADATTDTTDPATAETTATTTAATTDPPTTTTDTTTNPATAAATTESGMEPAEFYHTPLLVLVWPDGLNGSFIDSDSDSDSNPIPILDSLYWNLNLASGNVKF